MATANQVINRKERNADAKGGSNTKDIRIENFDVAFGNKLVVRWYSFLFGIILCMVIISMYTYVKTVTGENPHDKSPSVKS